MSFVGKNVESGQRTAVIFTLASEPPPISAAHPVAIRSATDGTGFS